MPKLQHMCCSRVFVKLKTKRFVITALARLLFKVYNQSISQAMFSLESFSRISFKVTPVIGRTHFLKVAGLKSLTSCFLEVSLILEVTLSSQRVWQDLALCVFPIQLLPLTNQ